MAKKYPDPDPDPDGDAHPSQSHSDRFPTDQLLRSYQFVIHSRPHDREALWRRRGQLFGQSEAVELIATARKAHAGP